MITWKHTMIAATGGVLALVGWIAQTAADVQIGSDFQTSEAVTSIRVELQVGADGADLDEPVALDLGLGFPLWLAPVGQAEGQPAPFGAVPQTGPAGRSIRAGEQARFEFLASGDPGQDALHTTQQLLAGTHVSDISRVAFTSRAEHGWILAGYTIQVNGKLLASNNALNVNAHQRQEAARERRAPRSSPSKRS